MAEAQAGQGNAQQGEDKGQQQQQQQDGVDGKGDDQQQQQQQQAERTYTQAELDRILGKVRKNARYLGRKEAEAELRAQGASPSQARDTITREQEKEPVAPKREDFGSYEEYLDAKSEFAGRKAAREERAKLDGEEKTRQATARAQKTQKEFKTRAEAAAKDISDFADVIENAEDVMITTPMGEAIEESPLGPRILYLLAKDPKEAERISELSPGAQIREIGKLEARIEAELAKAAKDKEAKNKDGGDDQADDNEKDGQDAAGAGDKGEQGERNADGTFKSPKKKTAPDPIEPGSARGANTTRLPSDKDDIQTWMRKREDEERRAAGK